MGIFISERLVIESDQDDVEVMVDLEGNVLFSAASGHVFFEMSKAEWESAVEFISGQFIKLQT